MKEEERKVVASGSDEGEEFICRVNNKHWSRVVLEFFMSLSQAREPHAYIIPPSPPDDDPSSSSSSSWLARPSQPRPCPPRCGCCCCSGASALRPLLAADSPAISWTFRAPPTAALLTCGPRWVGAFCELDYFPTSLLPAHLQNMDDKTGFNTQWFAFINFIGASSPARRPCPEYG
jgi:hypothetical protein